MPNEKFKLMLIMVIIAIVVCLVLWIMAIIGGMNLTNGCFYRYNFDSNGNLSSGSSTTDTVVVNASGNYSGVTGAGNGVTLDPSSYGKWVNTNLRTKNGQSVSFKINGEISLCRAYVPINNVQQASNLDVNGKLVPIPRIEEMATPPVSLIMDARNGNWGNLTEIFKNDEYIVALQKDVITTSTQTSQYDYFAGNNINANCAQGSRTYSPICGRYTLWTPPQQYVSNCNLNLQCYKCNCACYTRGLHWSYWPSDESTCLDASGDWDCDWCSCYENVMNLNPEPYSNDGQFTIPTQVTNVNDVLATMSQNCSVNPDYIRGAYQNQRYMWFSANIANGLLTRIDTSINPTNQSVAGSNYSLAQIATDQSFYNNSNNYNIITHETSYNGGNVGYLQYRLLDFDGAYQDNTGGYVINIRQTKCKRKNGVGIDDIVQGRGWVQYVIVDYDQNPNTTTGTLTPNIINVDSNGKGAISVNSSSGGYLWLRIVNAPQDYKDSIGQYNVSFTTSITQGGFFNDVLNPLFEGLKTKIKTASITVFKNMTCYQGIGGTGACTNFFNYIKGLLILYIMFYGMMFLLGNLQINQTDIVIRVIKVGLVAGLINNSTFEFFSQYVFDFVTNFSDNIIANMSGYSLPSGGVSVSNPLMFMDEVFTKFFLSSTFAAQIMALLSMGINGVLYFIIIFVTIGITIIVGFRAIAVYLMAYLAIAVLIGIAPLFLTFILFQRTRYLFDNWVQFTFRYMIEPTVMLAGIIILMQLFTIFLDYVIGYSVCWKCALPFKLPFPSIPGFSPEFLNVPLFCFNWFAPWGFDYMSTPMGINMSNMVILLMLAYCMWGWIEFSSKIVARLAGGSGGPSATSMGLSMTSPIEQKALGKVGLDEESRAEIKQAMKARLSGINKGNEEAPLQKRQDAGSDEVKGKKDAK